MKKSYDEDIEVFFDEVRKEPFGHFLFGHSVEAEMLFPRLVRFQVEHILLEGQRIDPRSRGKVIAEVIVGNHQTALVISVKVVVRGVGPDHIPVQVVVIEQPVAGTNHGD